MGQGYGVWVAAMSSFARKHAGRSRLGPVAGMPLRGGGVRRCSPAHRSTVSTQTLVAWGGFRPNTTWAGLAIQEEWKWGWGWGSGGLIQDGAWLAPFAVVIARSGILRALSIWLTDGRRRQTTLGFRDWKLLRRRHQERTTLGKAQGEKSAQGKQPGSGFEGGRPGREIGLP